MPKYRALSTRHFGRANNVAHAQIVSHAHAKGDQLMLKITTLSLLLFSAVATCRAQSLSASDILDWNLTITDPLASTTTVTLEGPLSGNNSLVQVLGSDLTATSSDLLFNYSATDGGLLLFQFPPLGNGSNFWCNSSANLQYACSLSVAGAESAAANSPSPGGYTLPVGNLVIASGGTPQGTDILYDVDQTWVDNGLTFSAVGTITTDGALTATPEPSGFEFLTLATGFLAFLKIRAVRNS